MTRLDVLIVVIVAGFILCWLALQRISTHLERLVNAVENLERSADSTNETLSGIHGDVSDIENHLNPHKLEIDPEP
jgi:hypothetical protein